MNKLTNCFTFILATFIISTIGCKKIPDPISLNDFSVSTSKLSYNINDTAVFSINDKSDILLFYSGQPGMSINYRNRYYGKGINILKFQDSAAQGTANNIGDSLHLFVLTNLRSYDSVGISNATKFDITSLVQWPTSTSRGWVSSGSIDLTQFNIYDTVYIAFQALGHKSTLTAQRKFLIQNVTLSNLQLPDSAFTPLFYPPYSSVQSSTSDTLPNFSYAGWAQVDMKFNRLDTLPPSYISTNYGAWNVGNYGYSSTNTPYFYNNRNSNSSGVALTGSYPVTFDPGNNAKTNKIDYEGWLITSPVSLNTVRHDFPTAILKDASNTVSKGFRFINSNNVYATYSLILDTSFISGKTYDMAFVAQNVNVDKKNEKIKHLSIRIN